MPEVSTPSATSRRIANALQIAEVARIVHFLKKHAVGRTIEAVKTQEDDVCVLISISGCKHTLDAAILRRSFESFLDLRLAHF
jgi:hypothetical protein